MTTLSLKRSFATGPGLPGFLMARFPLVIGSLPVLGA